MDRRTPGQVVVTFEYSRHVGPKYVHGGVSLRFDWLQPYSFESRAQWPADNYDAHVRAAVECGLQERCGALDMCRVVLESIAWHEVDSCAIGFERAARAATEMAFVV
jgi:hypothetical protein